ncbi:MAG: zinc-ribbon domain-containing protein [Armatimonadetes bacterium]|nr:zinc-ribbon domain-containing protein [Armatimonadota bacterium]
MGDEKIAYCPFCGRPLPDNSTTCPHCSVSVDPGYCPCCGRRLSAGLSSCPSCGHSFPDSQARRVLGGEPPRTGSLNHRPSKSARVKTSFVDRLRRGWFRRG